MDKEEEKKESGPQIENGHIDIANELVEALARTQLSGYESRVLWALWRMTWGYAEKNKKGQVIYKVNKKGNRQPLKIVRAKISSKKWERLTGLDKANIYKTLRRLCKRNIVIKNDNKYKSITWEFQKHYKQWDKEGFGVPEDTKGVRCPERHRQVSRKTPPGVQIDNKIITKPLENKADVKTKKTSLKKTYIKKGKNDIYISEKEEEKTEEKEIFDYWNSLDIIDHKTFDFFKNDIKKALESYSLEEIKKTIKNYSIILTDERYFYSYKHTILGFLDPKNFEKFKDLEKAKKNYQENKLNSKPELSDDTQGSEYQRYKPAPGIKETEEERKARYKESESKIRKLKEDLKEKKGSD